MTRVVEPLRGVVITFNMDVCMGQAPPIVQDILTLIMFLGGGRGPVQKEVRVHRVLYQMIVASCFRVYHVLPKVKSVVNMLRIQLISTLRNAPVEKYRKLSPRQCLELLNHVRDHVKLIPLVSIVCIMSLLRHGVLTLNHRK